MSMLRRRGFTLLEIIIVIIIIGVLASLALPRLFSAVEGAKRAEAISNLSAIRGAMERCYLMNNGTYQNCEWDELTALPNESAGAYFMYLLDDFSKTATGYQVQAIFKQDPFVWPPQHYIIMDVQNGSAVFCGTGYFKSLGSCP